RLAVGTAQIDGGTRSRDVERDAEGVAGEREAERADLVGGVAVARDAVGARDGGKDFLFTKRGGGGAVGQHEGLHSVLFRLPHREPRPLPEGTGLQRVDRGASSEQDAERGADPARGERAGVADRENGLLSQK